jgi:hypothetical protein
VFDILFILIHTYKHKRTCTYIHVYIHEQRPSWGTEVLQTLKKFPTFFGTRRFIALFTKSEPLIPILSQINPVNTKPSFFSNIHINVILNLNLGLPNCLSPSSFLTRTLYTVILFYRWVARSAYLILLALINLRNYMWRSVQDMKLLVVQLSPVYNPCTNAMLLGSGGNTWQLSYLLRIENQPSSEPRHVEQNGNKHHYQWRRK